MLNKVKKYLPKLITCVFFILALTISQICVGELAFLITTVLLVFSYDTIKDYLEEFINDKR